MRLFLFRSMFLIVAMIMLSGCGKNIPVIDPASLENKSSVLLLTEQGFSSEAKQKLQNAMLEWRDKKQTAFEWITDVNSLTDEQFSLIRQKDYDYIIVIGHQLLKSALPQAESINTSKWIMLDDQISSDKFDVKGQHISLLKVNESMLHAEWDEWVRQQQVTGRAIEWVTKAADPITSDWALSEEAEFVTLVDSEDWYTQLQFQVKSHSPSWIVAYSSLETAQLARLRSLQVPVVNMMKTTMELQWDQLLLRLSEMVSNKTWSPGIKPYENGEVKMNKNF